jgi:hypothetical protein
MALELAVGATLTQAVNVAKRLHGVGAWIVDGLKSINPAYVAELAAAPVASSYLQRILPSGPNSGDARRLIQLYARLDQFERERLYNFVQTGSLDRMIEAGYEVEFTGPSVVYSEYRDEYGNTEYRTEITGPRTRFSPRSHRSVAPSRRDRPWL